LRAARPTARLPTARVPSEDPHVARQGNLVAREQIPLGVVRAIVRAVGALAIVAAGGVARVGPVAVGVVAELSKSVLREAR